MSRKSLGYEKISQIAGVPIATSFQIDDLDRRILDVLSANASLSMRELAEAVSSTTPTCHRRVQRLKQAGAIRSIVARVDPAFRGDAQTVIFGLTLRNQRREAQQSIARMIGQEACIRLGWMTTGEFDYVIVAGFEDRGELGEFVERRLQAMPDLERYRTFVSLEELKAV